MPGVIASGKAVLGAADKAKRDALRAAGWTVLTFWGGQIVRDAESCAREIITALNAP